MKISLRTHTAIASVVFSLALAASAPSAFAIPTTTVTYSNPIGDYGTVPNNNCNPGGICAAAEAENSFIFLSNYYPTVYAGTNITTGGAGTTAGAANQFAIGTQTGNPGGFTGYYNLPGTATGDYITALNAWLTTYAPNTSYVVSSGGANLLQNFLGPQLQQHEDVELFIYNAAGSGHVISPYSVTYDPNNPGAGGSMSYQDPNGPENATVQFTIDAKGQITFTDPVSGLGTVTATSGYAESPAPEPSSLYLLGSGLLGLAGVARRKLRRG